MILAKKKRGFVEILCLAWKKNKKLSRGRSLARKR
jgi:hypothetical protein